MFAPLRKKEREMSKEFVEAILDGADYSVLSLVTEDGYPYGVPVNYVYHNNAIYIHSGRLGLKYETIQKSTKACFTIVSKHLVLPKQYTTAYQSIIAFGTLSLIEEKVEKDEATLVFCEKYVGQHKEEAHRRINNGLAHMALIKFDIEHITGKERPEHK